MKAMMRLGHNFKEFDSNSTVMIVLEGQQPLGDDAHHYYDNVIRQLRQDPKHIQHIQDFWGDRLTAAGAQSADAKASYVMLNLAGNQGTTLANDSVEAVRKVIDRNQPPPGVKAYVTGPAALSDDMHVIGNASLAKITLFTLAAIAIMLLLVYRSIVTTLVQLFMTGDRAGMFAGSHCGSRVSRCVRAHHVRREHPHDAGDRGRNGLRHLPGGPLSRGARGRRGSGNGVLHDVSFSGARLSWDRA